MTQIKRSVLFISLYLAQGLPYGFFMQAVPVLMRKSGSSLALVGASSLLALPWGIKFLWAPLVDRIGLAKIGLRRSWILPLQFATISLFLILATFSPETSMPLILQGVLLTNLFAATQDIATDAFAIDILSHRQRGWAGGIKVGAYRVGMILGGGVILQFALFFKWSGLMCMLALLSLTCTLPVLFYREGPESFHLKHQKIHSYQDALVEYVRFFQIPGVAIWVVILIAYKSSHYAATQMLRPWLSDLGYSLTAIASVLSTAGFIAGFLGAVTGGWLASRTDRRRLLGPLGFLQVLGVTSYLLPLKTSPQIWKIYLATSADHFTSGVADVFLFTLMMDACRHEHAASEYALQACIVVLATTASAALSGLSAQAFGYETHFLASAALGLATATLTWALMRNSSVRQLLDNRRDRVSPDAVVTGLKT